MEDNKQELVDKFNKKLTEKNWHFALADFMMTLNKEIKYELQELDGGQLNHIRSIVLAKNVKCNDVCEMLGHLEKTEGKLIDDIYKRWLKFKVPTLFQVAWPDEFKSTPEEGNQ